MKPKPDQATEPEALRAQADEIDETRERSSTQRLRASLKDHAAELRARADELERDARFRKITTGLMGVPR